VTSELHLQAFRRDDLGRSTTMRATRLRRTVSLATRGRTFQRRLPAEFGGGAFLASTDGGLKFLNPDAGTIDPLLTGFARTYIEPGHNVWDVGANVGLFTAAAAGLAGKTGMVLAIEPDQWLHANLVKTARLNRRVAPIHPLPVAISSRSGISAFVIANQSRARNALQAYERPGMEGVRELRHVACTTLDSLLESFPPPNVVKIDVEGAELAVLEGASRVLAEARPVMLIEVGSESADGVAAVLTKWKYRLLDAESMAAVSRPAFNTVAVPESVALSKRRPDTVSACGLP
jgi:FkbM family methyltransferase